MVISLKHITIGVGIIGNCLSEIIEISMEKSARTQNVRLK